MINAKSACWDRNEPLSVNLFIIGAFFTAFSLPGGRILTVLALIAWLGGCVRIKSRPVMPAVGWLVLVYFAWITLALWWGPAEHIRSSQLYKNLFWLSIPLAFGLMTTTARRIRLLMALAAGSLVLALRNISDSLRLYASLIGEEVPFDIGLAAEQILHHRRLGGQDVLGQLISAGDMQHAQMLAAGLFFIAGAWALAPKESAARRWSLLGLVLMFLSMLITFKRLAVTAVVVACLAWGLLLLMRRWPLRAAATGSIVVLVVVTLLAGAFCFGPPSGWPGKIEQAAKSGGRVCMWTKVTPALVKEYPFGIGYKALTTGQMQSIARHVEKDREHVHSNLLQSLIDGGWPGLFLFLWILVEHMRNHLRHLENAHGRREEWIVARSLGLASLVLVACGLFEYQLGSGQVSLLYAGLLGAVAAGAKPSPA